MNLAEIKMDYPSWLPHNVHYMTYMGSIAYGVNTPDSDFDVYGYCIPPKDYIFQNIIYGFDKPKEFKQWEQQHVIHKEREYDFTIRNMVDYFKSCMEGNPNMIDSLFTPLNCVIKITSIGNLVRENRKLFLSKKLLSKMKGYAYGQLADMKRSKPSPDSKRKVLFEKFGFDTKAAYNVVRLLSQIEQILVEEDLVLDEVGRREHMKAIRRGEVPQEEIVEWAKSKEKQLETIYANSKLPNVPRKDEIRSLLVQCLDIHYGSIPVIQDEYKLILSKIKEITDKVSL